MTITENLRRDRPQGLYSAIEHDSCGVSFVVDLKGRPSHDIVVTALEALCNLQHRGALGAEANTGDGAGIMVQVPDRFFRAVVDAPLPPAGRYATGIAFLPRQPAEAEAAAAAAERIVADEGLRVIAWREVPVDPSTLGAGSRSMMPIFRQVFIAGPDGDDHISGIDLDRRVYVARKRIEHEVDIGGTDESADAMGGASSAHSGIYFPSLSARTFVYKGMLTTPQLADFYPDLGDERLESALALVHSRFSTNTFPSWPLAHPYRYVAHNGEINTLRGNRNWLRAREALMGTPLIRGDLEHIFPISTPEGSDSASFDECLELLVMSGYSLPEAVLMMIPEPWENHESMGAELTDFYRYHASLMEPWDGPASIIFSDGTTVGAVLDRNGLRPSRYWVTDDDRVIMASEVGVVDVPSHKIIEKGRLQPGRIFFIDTTEGRIVRDPEIKSALSGARPYRRWLEEHQVELDDLPDLRSNRADRNSLTQRQQTFGYTHEELRLLVTPMVQDAREAVGSMGNDAALAVLSQRSRLLYDYFKQLFAQVTNPPLDAIREEVITATLGWLGPEGNLLDPQPASCRQILIRHPVLTDGELAKLIAIEDMAIGEPPFSTEVISCLFPISEGGAGLRRALNDIRSRVSAAIAAGADIIVLSDRGSNEQMAPIPTLLATGAVHHHLVREKSRTRAALVVETGEMREVHHLCCLLGYGANAVNPYLVFETIDDLIDNGMYGLDPDMNKQAARHNYIEACEKGLLKVMSKMGISTVKSYIGAQIFEAIGIGGELIDECFTGTTSRLGGIGYDELAEECALKHRCAYPENPRSHRDLEIGGQYQWRPEGEYHLFNPDTVFKLQHSTRTGRYDIFKEYSSRIDDQSSRLATLRGLFRFRFGRRPPVPLDEVEPASSIVTRFTTGAMSYGSISREAHETIAIAMNRIGAKSNTGEGGEDPNRYTPDANGDVRRSAVKQVASGRFGVTSEYLVNADDIQIKMAQGAKPGEGGQLPGHKVWPWIAQTRHSTPGVGLISPPPHHDIYSIEDLAQLIHDLKNANPQARIHVKLVSELGVGTVAAGVAKAHADVVLISGHDGGTGASPLTSIKHAGTPWELGLAETQQTLLLNNLRDRIVVQVDGQLKTGRDVMIAALLGAEEFGFATTALVVLGCVMMRVCHLDTCPVGVATQNPALRDKFSGRAEYLVNFMEYVAEEVRELLAALGFRSLEEAVGHAELLDVADAVDHWKASGLDLSPILHTPELADDAVRHQTKRQDHRLDKALDETLIQLCEGAIADGSPIHLELPIRNVNRTVGTMLGNLVTKRWNGGLPDDTIAIDFSGSAGQSFGAFLPRGITLRLTGDANDYLGKGLSGGRIVVLPPKDSPFVAQENVIAGNVILYGATGGEVFLRGVVGERFCVRNSGAVAVVEGIGDHGCEYMTGGRAVILGRTGRNFGAGMSGGIAYVYDPGGTLPAKVNLEMVDLDPMNDDDVSWLRQRVQMHLAETTSEVAARLLANWEEEAALFCKVMPKDYRRVLEAMAQAEREGTDPIEAVMEAAHG